MTQDSLQDARYAPPRAAVDDVAEPDGAAPELAGRAARLVASLLDVAVAVGATWLVSQLTPWNPFDLSAARGLWTPILPEMLVGFLLFVLLQGWLLARRGQTLGKLALGLRIVRPDGSAASPGRAIGLRYGLGYLVGTLPMLGQVFAVVDCLMIFRSSRRCLHDVIADTIVVKA